MKTILVDDEPWMLQQFEYESQDIADIDLVGRFTSPYEALSFSRDNRVELAFMDVEMPGMNGIELARKLREQYPGMIVVFVSAYEKYVAEAILNGADCYVTKPYTGKDLEVVMKKVRPLANRAQGGKAGSDSPASPSDKPAAPAEQSGAVIRYKDDVASKLTYMDDKFLALVGYTRSEVQDRFGDSLRALVEREDYDAAAAQAQRQVSQGQDKRVSYRLVAKGGTRRWVKETGHHLDHLPDGGDDSGFQSVIVDIDSVVHRRVEERSDAHIDPLTGLIDIQAAEAQVLHYLADHKGECCALARIEVDDFDHAVQTYGSKFSNTVLTDVAAIVQRSCRTCDIVANTGQTETMVFLKRVTDLHGSQVAMERVFGALRRRFERKTRDGELSCSAGVVLGPEFGEDFQTLYQKAGEMLSQARRSGGNQVEYYAEEE